MKSSAKRIMSLVLAVLLICLSASSAAALRGCNCDKTPIVYLIGRTPVYNDVDNRTATMEGDSEKMLGLVDDLMPYFEKAVFLGKWDEYYDAFINSVAPIFTDYVLDNSGNITNNSGIGWSWSEDRIDPNHDTNDVYRYKFEYDARLDPCEIADELNDYIEAVKRRTGHSKIALVSRCLGCNIATAYLEEYAAKDNYAGIETCILYAGAMLGFDEVGTLFSGRMSFDADSLDRYLITNFGNGATIELLRATVSLFNDTHTLQIGTALANRIYKRLYKNILPGIMRSSYGTMPGYWAMVPDEYYNDAKALIFGGAEEQYVNLIAKIDNYHYNVQSNVIKMVESMNKDYGVKTAIICKYGFQNAPINENNDKMTDRTIDVYSQSFGATCADVDGTLSKKYIEEAKAKGTDKYISVDKQIDASTCLFPDSTWFIKNLVHNPFPNCGNKLLLEICRCKEQPTIYNIDVPQYQYYDTSTDSLSPLTEENCNTNEAWNHNFFTSFKHFFEALFRLIKESLQK